MAKKMNKIVGLLFYSVFILGIMFLLPFTISLAKAGFDEPQIQNLFYFYLISGSIGFLITIVGIIALFILKKDNKYISSLGFFNIGEKPAFKFWKRFTTPQLTLLSLIGFSTIFLIANISGVFIKSFVGLSVLPQQFSPTDSLLFSSALIPVAENLVLSAVLVSSLIGLVIFAMKSNIKETEFKWLARLGIPTIGGIFGWIWHQSVYAGQETAGLVVFFFWWIMSFLNIATGFFGVGHIMHFDNNFFIDISRFLSSEAILGWIGIIIVGLIIIYTYIYRGRLLGGKSE